MMRDIAELRHFRSLGVAANISGRNQMNPCRSAARITAIVSGWGMRIDRDYPGPHDLRYRSKVVCLYGSR